MKKLFSILIALALICSFTLRLRAELETAPKTGEGVNLTDFNYVGCDYKWVTSTSWETVCSGDGILYDIYAVRVATATTGDCYINLGSLTSEATTYMTRAAALATTDVASELTDESLISYPMRFKVGLRAKTSTADIDWLILYRKVRY